MTDNQKKIEQLLETLAERGFEKPRGGLVQEIKSHIPARLSVHRLDTINIIVDLRVSRLAAAAAIIIVVVLLGSYFAGRDPASGGIFADGRSVIRYALRVQKPEAAGVLEVLASYRDSLVAEGKEVVFYGDSARTNDPHAILMHWQQDDDRYGVIFADFSTRTVNGKTLIRLQARMIQQRRR